jgi:spore coat protein U-like protein
MRKTVLALALMAAFGATALEAQTATATGNVSITINKVAHINVPSGNVNFATPGSADFAAGEIAASNSVDVQYGANAPHELQIHIDGLGGKNVGDLQWSVDTGTSWTPMTTAAQPMVTAGSPGAATTTVDFKMLLDFTTDVAGTYGGQITYTVVAN